MRRRLRSVPSWGMSFLLHALLLLLLAFIIHIRQAPVQSQLTIESGLVETQLGEIESVNPDKRSGDPFTLDDSPDPPSLGLEPADSSDQACRQPQIALHHQYAPALAGPLLTTSSKADRASIKGIARLPNLATTIVAPFSGRQELDAVPNWSGARAERPIPRNRSKTAWTGWYATSGADGSWSLNFHDQCQASPCPSQHAMDSDTAATGSGSASAPGRRLHSHGQEPPSKCRAARPGMAGCSSATRRRPVHRTSGHGVSLQPCDRHDGHLRGATGSPAIPS